LRLRAAPLQEPEDAGDEVAAPSKANAKAKVALGPGSRRPVTPDEFLAALPQDSHTDEEASLRTAIIAHLQTKRGSAPLSEIIKDEEIAGCKTALLPLEVPLKAWIDSRIGGEVETTKDERGKIICRLREEMAEGDAEAEAEGEAVAEENPEDAEKEAFFAQLPPDGFTTNEEFLREALLDFHQAWEGSQSPMISQAEEDRRVWQYKKKVLPPGAHVSLAEWIHRRIGGELEVSEVAPGQVFFGMRGLLVLPNAKKRRSGANSQQGPPWKKGGKGGRDFK